jgi:predicted aspartyl protease
MGPITAASTIAALALAVIANGAPQQPTIANPVLPDVLTVGRDQHQRMTMQVTIGDHGPFEFMIDTAAQATVVSTTLAGRLGLTPQARRQVLGVAGTRSVDTVEIDDIRFGRYSYDGRLAPLLDAADVGADGILGLDGLQGRRVLLDFQHGRIALVDAHERGANKGYEIVVTARRKLGQLILTNAEIDGIRTDLVIDTGAETSVGNRALQRALRQRKGAGTTTLHSVTGQDIAADLATAGELTIDRAHISNVSIAYADAPTFTALNLDKRPALLLGMNDLRLFHRVAIDFAARKVLFDLPKSADLGG